MPIFYECDRCTACCRWPGEVKLRDGETERIAAYLQLSEDEFIQKHTRLQTNRRGLALTDKANGECSHLHDGQCRIQAVKPQQCREFPNLWNFPGFEKVCQAVPHSLSDEDYQRRIQASLTPSPSQSSNHSSPSP